jgi:hypothetical protein
MKRLSWSNQMTRRLSLVGIGGLMLFAAAFVFGAFPAASAYRQVRPDKSVLTFRANAGGQAAPTSTAWRISLGSGGATGLIVAAAVCGDEAFLLDRRLAVVHRVDLAQHAIVGRLGGSSALDRLETPAGIAADCDGRRVYVVDSTGVVVFDADMGTVEARFAKPPTFVNSIGPAILDPDAQVLYAPGLLTPIKNDWLHKPVRRMFEGDGVGYRLDLTTGRTSAMVRAVERGCWSLGPNCLYATLDRVHSSQNPGWIAAHRVGAAVGVFDADFRLVRTIDIRSPMFLENGEQNESTSLEAMVAWNEQNSVIRGCFSFDNVIATVHSFNRTKRWKPGQPTDFEVFMNVHSLDGQGRIADVKLPGLPVGRDDTSLYVIDYGAAGRRPIGDEPITLMKIPVVR